jgi:hypothetical protein
MFELRLFVQTKETFQMRKQLFALSLVGLMVFAFSLSLTTRAAEGATITPGFVVNDADGSDVTCGATAKLVRTDTSMTAIVKTCGLVPGAYSLWWVIFNEPELEGPPDIIVNATGKIVGPSGEGNFAASISVGGPYGEIGCPGVIGDMLGIPCSGDGLLNPRGALAVLVIRYHGPAIPGMNSEQFSTFMGGCPGGVGCVDMQDAVFLP